MDNKEPQYIYIVQSNLEPSKCKIGRTNNLDRRLAEYNKMTGTSQEQIFSYLFTCKVEGTSSIELDLKNRFPNLREEKSREIYFYNKGLFEEYVGFIKAHPCFINEVFIKIDAVVTVTEVTKLVQRVTPSLEERGLSKKELLQKAQNAYDNDEFYTRYEDVEKELTMYPASLWVDKVVFCNCDDAVDQDERRTSAFSLYFMKNFHQLGLKKLICTHYSGPVDLFHQGSKGYVFTKKGFEELKNYPKNYNGSFDHPLSLKILNEEADIVCTNPPFSKAIAYWDLLIKSGKKFVIISNITNAINTAFIPYFRAGLAWAGYNRIDWFQNPKRQLTDASGHWYTNMPIIDRPKHQLLKIVPLEQIPCQYQKIDDNGILLVDKGYIPSDYRQVFAVSARPILNGVLEKGYIIAQDKRYEPFIKGKQGFARVLIQKA